MTEPKPVRIELAGIRFAWDELKDQANLARHGVAFSEAATVFLDPLALYLETETVEGEIRELDRGLESGAPYAPCGAHRTGYDDPYHLGESAHGN